MKNFGEVPGAQKARDMIGYIQEVVDEISYVRLCTLMAFELLAKEYRVTKDEDKRRRIGEAVEQLLSDATDDLDERLEKLLELTS